MKKIALTQGKFALVDDEDYEALSKFKWCYHKPPASYSGYAVRAAYSKLSEGGHGSKGLARMHHEILKRTDGFETDHIDGDGLNNTRANLRYATKSQNQQNKRLSKNNTTGFKGVCFIKTGMYKATIRILGKRKFLGYFTTPEEAHEAFKKSAIELHGEFAKW